MKFLLKLLALPIIVILKLFVFLGNTIANLSAYAIAPVLLLIAGCSTYCVFTTQWDHLAILASIGALVFVAFFGAATVISMADITCDKLKEFWHS